MDFSHVYAVLGDWSGSGDPLYVCLARALERAIGDGTLPLGTLLPPERQLAKELQLSRGTVEAAYDDLRAKGLVTTRRGSGTTVADEGQRRIGPREIKIVAAIGGASPMGGLSEQLDDGVIDLRTAYWAGSDDLPEEAFALAGKDFARYRSGRGYHPAGIEELRAALATHLTRSGLPTEPGHVLITSGSQQALSLISELLIEPRDHAVVESITNPRGVASFRARGASILTVPTGRRGLDVDALVSTTEHRRPRIAHIMPGMHDTTGSVLPAAAARRLADASTEHDGTLIIDDRSLSPLWLAHPPPAPLAAYRPEASNLVTVGSLSRWTWAGLRIGWLRAPKQMVARLARLKAYEDAGCSVVDQVIALRLLDRAEEIAERRRTALRQRYDLTVGLLAEHVPEFTWVEPSGGLCLWVELPAPVGVELTRAASSHKVLLLPGSALMPGGGGNDHIRLPFGLEPVLLTDGIARLAAAWADLRGGRPPGVPAARRPVEQAAAYAGRASRRGA